jgi:hypothetical protein
LAIFKRRRFARPSERPDSAQQSLLEGSIEEDDDAIGRVSLPYDEQLESQLGGFAPMRLDVRVVDRVGMGS